MRRPSKYQTTKPQTIPSGKPFRKIAITFKLFGARPKPTKASSAQPIKEIVR